MTTLVGTPITFEEALYQLCELDYDVVEAYEIAIERLENQQYKIQFANFKRDLEHHIYEISNLLKKHNELAPSGPSSKHLIVWGKVIFANLFGDQAILRVMWLNEIDINTAYERLHHYKTKWHDAMAILRRGLGNERRHKRWFETTLSH